MFDDLLVRLSSRKFLAFFSIALVLAADNFGLTVDAEIRKQLVTIAIAYMAVEGSGDAIRAFKQ